MLVIVATFVNPLTLVRENRTYSFLCDDASHSSVSDCITVFFFFCTNFFCRCFDILTFSFVYQDLVHHCTDMVLGEVRLLYTAAHRDPRQLKYLHLWSDNCASQFKCANTFGWASRYLEIGKLIAIVSCFLENHVYMHASAQNP